MKKLIAVLIISGLAISANAFNFPDIKKLKSPKKLSDIGNKSEIACDLCGCYMGLDPYYNKNIVGLRFHTIKFYSPAHPEVATPGGVQLDHAEHGNKESTEYYNGLELFGRYFFTPKLKLLVGLPISFNTIDNKSLNGMGDLKIITQYQLYNTNMKSSTKFWQRIFLGAGLKFPTGVYNKSLVYGVVEPHFQPGTGSLDFLFNGTYVAQFSKMGLGNITELLYTVNTANKNDYKFANRFNTTSTFFYDFPAGQFSLIPHLGIYFEYADNDTYQGKQEEDSGGEVLFGTGGLDTYYDNFSFDLTFQLPVSEYLYGEQPSNEFRMYVGLGYSF